MSHGSESFQLWRHVHAVSEALERDLESGSLSPSDLVGHLTAIEEVFGEPEEPENDFPSFVLLHLCRAMRKALQGKS